MILLMLTERNNRLDHTCKYSISCVPVRVEWRTDYDVNVVIYVNDATKRLNMVIITWPATYGNKTLC